MTHSSSTYAELQAPRYTSYPTAPHFSAQVGNAELGQWLADSPRDAPLSLYIHTPYCRDLCAYCGCNTYATRKDATIIRFVDTLLQEIDLVAKALGGHRLTEIHWGGGTPNILSPSQFSNIAGHIAERFDLDANIRHGIELDPRHLDADKVEAYVQQGVTRASLGVQDFNARVQLAMGRVQPVDSVRRAVRLLRNGGLRNISMDLMYGLPHQDTNALLHSLRVAASMMPQRISLFGYAHVPWFKKRQRLIPEDALPGALQRYDQAEAARAELKALGYFPVGLDHFALPTDELAIAAQTGRLRRSFQGYVADEASAIIGIGPSAISTLPQGYAQNASEPSMWMRAITEGRLATARGWTLSEDDRIRRRLIEQIMCDFSGDLRPLGGAAACGAELASLQTMISDGMASLIEDRVVVNDKGKPFCRLIAMAFDAYRQSTPARHSKAV